MQETGFSNFVLVLSEAVIVLVIEKSSEAGMRIVDLLNCRRPSHKSYILSFFSHPRA